MFTTLDLKPSVRLTLNDIMIEDKATQIGVEVGFDRATNESESSNKHR